MAQDRVIVLPSRTMVTCEKWSALRRKRKTLWNNVDRNILVAQVATACLEQDRKTLKQMGIPVRRKTPWGQLHRVVVLVESSEHANSLASLLQGWEVLTTLPTEDAADEPEEEEGIPLVQGSIATWMFAETHGLSANYLVRATGWRGRMDLDGWRENNRRLVVIDFNDEWDVEAVTDTEVRVQEYKDQGLEVVGKKEKQTATP